MKVIFTILLFYCSSCLFAQVERVSKTSNKEATSIDSLYLKYQMQLRTLYATRGISLTEAERILGRYRSGEIVSNTAFANLLGMLYPADKGIAILFYFFDDNRLQRIFFEPGRILDSQSVRISQDELIKMRTHLNASLNLYKQSEKRSPQTRGVKAPEEDTGTYNFDSLVKKLTMLLLPEKFNEKYQHLIVIPALNIGTFPFHLLKPYADSSWLMEKCSVTIAPSIQDLIVLRIKALQNVLNKDFCDMPFEDCYGNSSLLTTFYSDSALFVCNPEYPTNTKYYFPDLAGAKKEVDSAIRYTKRYQLLTGENATKVNVMRQLRNCDIAYFATHGMSSADNPMDNCFLVLSGNKDPFLTAKDIMSLRDSTFRNRLKFPEMVILSACQTGLGKSLEAGIAGLARSFLISGSRHVIMSLWNVNDDATAFLMNRFMFHLREPHLFVPAEPLRLAILDAKKEYPHPIYWAGFSLFGIDY